MSKLYLVLAFHNHQPVGNLDDVIDEAHHKAYRPFLETLLKHPSLKAVLHYSGHLLSWIQERYPESIEIIKSMVRTGRVEMLSGGYYEPVLPVLPERDGLAQISELSGYLRKKLGCTPRGIWLAERVWEPHLPGLIAKAGLDYLALDDYHFKLTGLEEGDLLGYYITEDEGHAVSVFPGSEKLRYFIPFGTVDETISYFREIYMRGGNPLLTLADDGEKFGVWPSTHKHCFTDGWLDSFFSALEKNSEWIETTTFSEYHAEFRPLGRVYLPSASYHEMGEWSLPSEKTLEYVYAREELAKIMGEKAKYLLRGGIWRSFMVKYPEANHLHKRMFMISDNVSKAFGKDSKKGRKSQRELWKGQCNDGYWHGIFGGLYLPHLRSSLYRHLIGAQVLAADILKENTQIKSGDFDCDGFDDIVAATNDMTVIASGRGGSLTELSLHKKMVNILDCLSRRPEAYHSKLTGASLSASETAGAVHNPLSVKEDGLAQYLVYDEHRRASLLDHFVSRDTRIEDFQKAAFEEMGDFIDGTYDIGNSRKGKSVVMTLSRQGMVEDNVVSIRKSIMIKGTRHARIDYAVEGAVSALFAVEMNISLLGSPDGLIRIGSTSMKMGSMAAHQNIHSFMIEDKFLNLGITFDFSNDMNIWHYPVETISLSEQGIERIYQGTAFLFVPNMVPYKITEFSCSLNFGEVRK